MERGGGGVKMGSAVIVTSESKVCTVYFDWNLDSLSFYIKKNHLLKLILF